MSDPTGKGFLDKSGLFVACKMVALVQADVPLTIDNAYLDAKTVPAPFFGPDTAPGAPTAKMAPADPGSVIQVSHFVEPVSALTECPVKLNFKNLGFKAFLSHYVHKCYIFIHLTDFFQRHLI
jgi:hypothetical protein